MLMRSQHRDSTISVDWDSLLSEPLNSSLVQGAISLVDNNGKTFNDTPEIAVYVFSEVKSFFIHIAYNLSQRE